ncbi:MAG: hypothetical protein KGJ44_04880 [Betaproteobacteria bacterium]|nr:hypothetical protein [Betaproteobacteria bacterium]
MSALVLQRGCLLLAVLLPAAVAYALWRDWPQSLLGALGERASAQRALLLAQLSWPRQVVTLALAFAPAVLTSMALLSASHFFAACARGRVLAGETVQSMRRFAARLLAAAVAGLAVPTLAGLALTAGGATQAVLVMSVGSQPILLIVFSALGWQMARVLARAVALAEENAQFI